VEELARLGRQQAVCPYYGARRAVPSADVLLVPYSAVLQPETRRSLGIELEGSVVVFDEAHNLLDAINGTHSAAVTGVLQCGAGYSCSDLPWMLGRRLHSDAQLMHGFWHCTALPACLQ
jgi:Rad3-related DNA helicase